MSEISIFDRFKFIIDKQIGIIKNIAIISIFFVGLLFVVGLLDHGQEDRQGRIIEEAVENVVGRHIAGIRDEMRDSREMMDSVLHIYSNFMQDNMALTRRHMDHLDEHMDHDHK